MPALKPEFLAEVEPAHIGAIDHLVRPPLEEHLTGVDDVGTVDQAERLADVVIGDEDADAEAGEVADEGLDVADGNRVDAGKGLIEKHEGRSAGERAGDFAAP